MTMTSGNGERAERVFQRHPSDRPTIGLLAGMGARSTGPFLDFVVDECQRQLGARQEADYPPMVVFSWPIPYYFDRELDHADLRETIAQGLEWLESTGVDFIAMPCNSAHVYFDSLVDRVTVPLINMVEAAADAVPSDAGPVALLATRSTRDSGLYQRALEARGMDVHCTDDMRARLDATLGRIREVSDLAEPRAWFGDLLADLHEGGAQQGLIACTDLNYLVEGESPLQLIDGGQALAGRVVSHWRSLLGPEDLKNPVRFRPTEEVDLQYVLALESDPDTAPYIAPWSIEEHRAALSDPTLAHWVLEDTERSTNVGFVILRSVGSQSIELKRIAISDKGRGYGKDAMRLVKAAAFGDLGAEHLWLDVYDFNERAQAVYRAEGFVTERSRPATEAGCAEGTAYVMGLVKT